MQRAESIPLGVGQLLPLGHHGNINAPATVKVKRTRLCRRRFERLSPRRLHVNRVYQHKPSEFVQRVLGYEIANALPCLVFNPIIDVLRGTGRVADEVQRFKRRGIVVLDERQKRGAEIVARLTEQTIGDGQGDRVVRGAPLLHLRGICHALLHDAFQRLPQCSKRAVHFRFIAWIVKHLPHLLACDAIRAGIGHGQRTLNGIGREERVGIRRFGFAQQIDPERVDGLGSGRSGFSREHGRGGEKGGKQQDFHKPLYYY